MLALSGILAGLLLGVLSGGRLSRLRRVEIRWQGLMLLLFSLQALVRGPLIGQLGEFGVPLWALVSVVLLGLVLLQYQTPGLAVVAAGIGCNALVIVLNGAMPVAAPPSLADAVERAVATSGGFYAVADARTILPFMGDVVPAGSSLASLGDILLAVGICVVLVSQVQADHRLAGRRFQA